MSIPESLHDAADDFRDRLHTSDVLSGSQKLMIEADLRRGMAAN